MRLSALALVAALMAAPGTAMVPTVAAAAEKAEITPACSGLPWPSGGSSGLDDLSPWRGSELDVRTVFSSHQTWEGHTASAAYVRRQLRPCGVLVVSAAMLPKSHAGQLAACAKGAFDHHMAAYGNGLVQAGAPSAVIRLGYEANISSFPWKITGYGQSWRNCYRRWVDVLRTVPGQAFSFIWNMNGRGQWTNAMPIDWVWPGDEYVDYVGVDYYDSCSSIATQADWDNRVNKKMKNGNPDGIGAWLEYARSKGKKLAVPEWGIGGPVKCKSPKLRPGYDNPLYIQNMYNFFAANAADIAYEALFNGRDPGPGGYRLNPTTARPLAAALYRELW